MQREKMGEGNGEQDNPSEGKSQAFRTIEERLEKRHRRASLGRLITYIIALIVVILLMLLLRSRGM